MFFFSIVTHQITSDTFCKVYWIQTNQEKAILVKMCDDYVTYAANVDRGQWHAELLLWSFSRIQDIYIDNKLLQFNK